MEKIDSHEIHKLDSVLKESTRTHPLDVGISLLPFNDSRPRKTRDETYTFANCITVPAGSTLVAAVAIPEYL
jgi:hypothetical protein